MAYLAVKNELILLRWIGAFEKGRGVFEGTN